MFLLLMQIEICSNGLASIDLEKLYRQHADLISDFFKCRVRQMFRSFFMQFLSICLVLTKKTLPYPALDMLQIGDAPTLHSPFVKVLFYGSFQFCL